MTSKYDGAVFGKLTVVEIENRTTTSGKTKQYALCKCACGEEKWRDLRALVEGKITKCGTCRSAERTALAKTGYKHPLYGVWCGMLQRCHAEGAFSYPDYGGRGIVVCDEWRQATEGYLGTVEGFRKFVSDMGTRPKGTSLGRIDNDGPYAKWNCRWETQVEQMNNTRANVRVELDGVVRTVAQWGRVFGTGASWAEQARKYEVPLHIAVRVCNSVYPMERWDWMALFGVDRECKVRDKNDSELVEALSELEKILVDENYS